MPSGPLMKTEPPQPTLMEWISRFWAARKRLLGKIDRKVLDGPIAEVPDELSWDYFQAAPADQLTTAHLLPDEGGR